MALSPIEQNYNFLNLTGRTRGVQAPMYTPQPIPVGGNGSESGMPSGRAVDRAPKAEMVQYNEYLPAQAGRDAGFSTKFLIA